MEDICEMSFGKGALFRLYTLDCDTNKAQLK